AAAFRGVGSGAGMATVRAGLVGDDRVLGVGGVRADGAGVLDGLVIGFDARVSCLDECLSDADVAVVRIVLSGAGVRLAVVGNAAEPADIRSRRAAAVDVAGFGRGGGE